VIWTLWARLQRNPNVDGPICVICNLEKPTCKESLGLLLPYVCFIVNICYKFLLFTILLFRFMLYEVRAATSFEVRALNHLQLLHTVPRLKKTVKNIISDNKLRKHMPCAKPEDILNASIQVIS